RLPSKVSDNRKCNILEGCPTSSSRTTPSRTNISQSTTTKTTIAIWIARTVHFSRRLRRRSAASTASQSISAASPNDISLSCVASDMDIEFLPDFCKVRAEFRCLTCLDWRIVARGERDIHVGFDSPRPLRHDQYSIRHGDSFSDIVR